jgi:Flp pilus assembly protein TadD
LAAVLETAGKDQEAIEHYRLAARFNPEDLETQTRLGRLLARNGRIDEAVGNFLSVARVKPSAQSTYDLALAYSIQGKVIEAVAEYRRALAFNPDWPIALNDLAWLLATNPQSELRNGCEAVRLAERACQLTQRKEPRFLGTLDAAYAEAGCFLEATRTAAETRALAESANQSDLAKAAEERLKYYQAGKAFHQSTSQPR